MAARQAVADFASHRVGQYVLAAASGAMAALAHPPFGLIGGLGGYGLWLWLCERPLPKARGDLGRAFGLGWVAGFVYFLISCFWVAEAFLVDAGTYGWMAPFAVCLLPAITAVYWGLTGLAYALMRPCLAAHPWPFLCGLGGTGRGLVFAALFSAFELLRGWLFTGFPWNPAGASWQAGSPVSQLASVVGVYGLGFVTLCLVTLPFVLDWPNDRSWPQERALRPLMIGLAILIGIWGFGAWRIAATPRAQTGIRVRLVQPDVGQKAKWTHNGFARLVHDYADMSRTRGKGRNPDLIVWPEGALPASAEDLFSTQSWTSTLFTHLLKPGQTLIFGAYRSDQDAKGREIWRNSMIVVQGQGAATRAMPVYDKYRLVPFGEFLPFEDLMGQMGVKSLVHFGDGFTPGPRTRPIQIPGIGTVLPLICYEGLYPGLADMDGSGPRPRMIVNISNDAWFGPTSGPVQHLNLASYRAIEEGLPLIRSTPTGTSAAVTPLGRVIDSSRIDIATSGFRDVEIQAGVEETFFSRHRRVLILCLAIFLSIIIVPHAPRVVTNVLKARK